MGTTSFDDMPHERMIAWLDKADNAAVQGAADRLLSAATEIDKIGEELKVRPQMVEWKGEGANSFRTWSADLANATLRLGLYSKEASKRLGEAAQAIAAAKAAAPRPKAGAEASLKAALSTPNDPDAVLLARELRTEKDAMAREMTKLSQAYNQSAERIGALEKPEFPPPPHVIAPLREAKYDRTDGYIPAGGTAGVAAGAASRGISAAGVGYGSPGEVAVHSAGSPVAHGSVAAPVGGEVSRPVGMEIDSVATLPTTSPNPPVVQPGVPGPGRPDGGQPATPVVLPPSLGGGPTVRPPSTTTGGGRAGGARPPMPAVTGNPVAGPPGRPPVMGTPVTGPVGRVPQDSGIVGGRPVAQPSGRPTAGLPRGTVVGGESTHAGRGMPGYGPGMGGAGGSGQSGAAGGRRLAGEVGGMVGRPQQPSRTGARPFTPGGTGLVRGTGTGDEGRGAGQMGRGPASSVRTGESRRDERERPDYLVEDEETWQQGDRRVVPPVID
ncbi:hypothetical protein ABT282_12535 [Streptomyces sp. NPDC000927]|uniref:hypothetical protein n=1 Tax=Streptomyces sp. NPDC000927 TaxID=3154371 RepID=UPI00331EC7BE